MLFQTTGEYGKFGSWGILENASQKPSTSPKYNALQSMLELDVCQ